MIISVPMARSLITANCINLIGIILPFMIQVTSHVVSVWVTDYHTQVML